MTNPGWNIWQKLTAAAGFALICLRLLYPVQGFIPSSGGGGYYRPAKKVTVAHAAAIIAAAAVLIRLSRTRREGWRLPSEHRIGISVRLRKHRR